MYKVSYFHCKVMSNCIISSYCRVTMSQTQRDLLESLHRIIAWEETTLTNGLNGLLFLSPGRAQLFE